MAEWTEERVEIVRKMHARGFSAGIIAQELGGVSRSAVMGKCHRLGLFRKDGVKGNGFKRGRKQRAGDKVNIEVVSRKPAPVFEAVPMPDEDVPSQAVITFAQLDPHHCRAIYGHPKGGGEWGYCGCDVVPGKSYCAVHLSRYYMSAVPKASAKSQAPAATREKVTA